MYFDMTASADACPVLPQSLASHAYSCWKIGSSWLHAHQRNPTALYLIGLPYTLDSPGRASAFTKPDTHFADAISLPLDSSLSAPHAASWLAVLDKDHGAFEHHAVCDLFARSLVPDGTRIMRMKCVWKVMSSQEGLAARFKVR